MKHILSTAAALLATQAGAHVTLEQPAAPAGKAYKAVLRVGHGCEGTATHTLSVLVPEGFRAAKPMPKPGWTITVEREPVLRITWQAVSREAWLPDAHYDEFVLRGQTPAQTGALWFKVRQVCEKGQNDWAEVPATGTSTKGLKAPAALLEVTAAEAAPAPHHH
jgi:periplasmic copper chaperone A